jgi:hypothetical protein
MILSAARRRQNSAYSPSKTIFSPAPPDFEGEHGADALNLQIDHFSGH